MKEKDQLFIFLNRKTTLLDTSTSKPGYHQVEEKDYKQLKFDLRTMEDVESYWYHLWTIAMHTSLGQRYAILGQTIQIDSVHYKSEMQAALKSKTPDMAYKDDNGTIPGDHRGAAGMDSALWVHLKRNWPWNPQNQERAETELQPKENLKSVRKRRLNEIKVKPVKYADLQRMRQAQEHKTPSALVSCAPSTSTAIPKLIIKKRQPPKPKRQVRKILPRSDSKRTRMKIDEIDHRIMKQMKKSRCIWTKNEDDILLILKIASFYLCEDFRKRMIPFNIVRDALHKFSPVSCLKTSKACHRRIVWLLRDEVIAHINESRENMVKQSIYIRKIYGPIREKLANCKISRRELYSSFVSLSGYLLAHQDNFFCKRNEGKPKAKEGRYIDYLSAEKIDRLQKVELLTDSDTSESLSYSEPRNEKQVMVELVKSIIHSSLSCKADKLGWTFQMFQVYQKFPESILRHAIKDLRKSEMISLKKQQQRNKKRERKNFITATPFQFNMRYSFNQHNVKFPALVYPSAFDFVRNLYLHKHTPEEAQVGFLIKDLMIGNVIGLSELLISSNITVSLKIPEEPLALNPSITDHTELIKVLAIRYKKLLAMVKDGTYYKDEEDVEQNLQNSQEKSNSETLAMETIEVNSDTSNSHNNKCGNLQQTNSSSSSVADVHGFALSRKLLNSIVLRAQKLSGPIKNTKDAVDNMVQSICDNLSQEEISDQPEQQVKSLYENLKSSGEFDFTCDDNEDNESEDDDCDFEEPPEETAPDTTDSCIKDTEGFLNSSCFGLKGWLGSPKQLCLPIGTEVTQKPGMSTHKEQILRHGETRLLDQGDISQKEYVTKEKKDPETTNGSVKISEKSENFKALSFKEDTAATVVMESIQKAAKGNYELLNLPIVEIMNKIAEKDSGQDRQIPGPTKLVYLLKKGLFPGDNHEYMEKFDQHYIINSPEAYVYMEDTDELYRYFMEEFPLKYTALIKKITSNAVLRNCPKEESVIEADLFSMGCSSHDLEAVKDLIGFLKDKKVLGATMKEIKGQFPNQNGNVSLLDIVRMLIDAGVFHVTGVTCLKCIHYEYRSHWTCQSTPIRKDETLTKDADVDIEIFPWIRVNGSLNQKILEDWLYLTLTTCITFPLASIERLTKQMVFLRPVDVFYLARYLQELDCIRLVAFESQEVTLTSDFIEPKIVPGTEFHEFNQICVEVIPRAVTTLGAFSKMRQHSLGRS